jgi:hypothetical protein
LVTSRADCRSDPPPRLRGPTERFNLAVVPWWFSEAPWTEMATRKASQTDTSATIRAPETRRIDERLTADVAKLWQMWRSGELGPSSSRVNVLSND